MNLFKQNKIRDKYTGLTEISPTQTLPEGEGFLPQNLFENYKWLAAMESPPSGDSGGFNVV